MKTIELPPIREHRDDYDRIERDILRVLKKELYSPLLRELGAPTTPLKNSLDDLVRAVEMGRIRFDRGVFRGTFSATTSRELKKLGAKWDRTQRAWRLHYSDSPKELRDAIATSEARFLKVVRRIDERLNKALPEEIAGKVDVAKSFDTALWRVERDVGASLKGIAITPKFTPEQAKKIADEYTQNLRLDIKGWAEKEIVELRKRVQERALKGQRYEDLAEEIGKSYRVARSKARFLARQETSLLMTKFKETRYTDAGVNEYRWQCVVGSPNHPVRPMHKALEGKIFSWDNPPITSPDGRRNNPGQDFNCRCSAKPIVRFKKSGE